MELQINDDEARRWFNLHPDTPIDIVSLMQHVDGHRHSHDMRLSLGMFLVRQMRQQAEATTAKGHGVRHE